MKPLRLARIADLVAELSVLDRFAEPVQGVVRKVVPQSSALKELLSGTWLGHPVHPPLTDVVIGTWTSALILDLVGGKTAERAADRLVATGILAAVPAAATGLSDWAELRAVDRRVGSTHALGNTVALLLNVASWSVRHRGSRCHATALSAAAYCVAGVSAWLGGELAFRRGVGVNQTAFDVGPSDWTPVCRDKELEEGRLIGAHAAGAALVLARSGGTIHALADPCSHRGCALHEGELHEGALTCPCHGSTFLLDGSIVRGPATAPQRTYQTRVRDGLVEVRS